PQVPLRLPCYDFTPVEDPTVVCANKTTKSLCGTSGTQKSWVIIGLMLRAKPIPRRTIRTKAIFSDSLRLIALLPIVIAIVTHSSALAAIKLKCTLEKKGLRLRKAPATFLLTAQLRAGTQLVALARHSAPRLTSAAKTFSLGACLSNTKRGVSNPVRSPCFRTPASVGTQRAAFAFGVPSSDCSRQLGNMKLESLVIAVQHAAVNMYPGPVHTARHTLGIERGNIACHKSEARFGTLLREGRLASRLLEMRPFGEAKSISSNQTLQLMKRVKGSVYVVTLSAFQSRSGGRPPESKGEILRLSPRDTIRYLNRLKESESSKFPVRNKREKDKIGTKPDQIKKKQEAWQRQEKVKAVTVDKGRKTEQNAKRMVKNANTVKSYSKFKEEKKKTRAIFAISSKYKDKGLVLPRE
nr:hypothetical protein [Tanacetum cinerariifolium]